MIDHITKFTPADGSAPRMITLRIGDLRPNTEGNWTVAVEVLGFEHDTRSRLMQIDWPLAIRDAARFVAQVTTDCVELAGGGTLDPPVYPPTLTEKKKKRKRHKRSKAKKDRK